MQNKPYQIYTKETIRQLIERAERKAEREYDKKHYGKSQHKEKD